MGIVRKKKVTIISATSLYIDFSHRVVRKVILVLLLVWKYIIIVFDKNWSKNFSSRFMNRKIVRPLTTTSFSFNYDEFSIFLVSKYLRFLPFWSSIRCLRIHFVRVLSKLSRSMWYKIFIASYIGIRRLSIFKRVKPETIHPEPSNSSVDNLPHLKIIKKLSVVGYWLSRMLSISSYICLPLLTPNIT